MLSILYVQNECIFANVNQNYCLYVLGKGKKVFPFTWMSVFEKVIKTDHICIQGVQEKVKKSNHHV